jgi:hypothetical protein
MIYMSRNCKILSAICVLTVTGVAVVQRSSAAEQGTGLSAEYFAGVEFQGAPVVSVVAPSINFDWGTGSQVRWLHQRAVSISFLQRPMMGFDCR